MKKIRFLQPTNIRKSKTVPDTTAILGVMNAQVIIEVKEDSPTEGMELEQMVGQARVRSNQWYECKNGWFYWAGSAVEISNGNEDSTDTSIEDIINREDFAKRVVSKGNQTALDDWLETKGKGVGVAVLDQNLKDSHPNIKLNLRRSGDSRSRLINATNDGRTAIIPNLDNTHGTATSLLLAGGDTVGNEFIGMAPLADLHFYRIRSMNKFNITPVEILRGLEQAINNERIDIISLSVGHFKPLSDANQEKLNTLYAKAAEKGKIIVCAGKGKDHEELSVLAKPEAVIIADVIYPLDGGPDMEKMIGSVDIYLPGGWELILPQEIIFEEFSSSFATPLVAGILANYLAFKRKNQEDSTIRETLSLTEAREKLQLLSTSMEEMTAAQILPDSSAEIRLPLIHKTA